MGRGLVTTAALLLLSVAGCAREAPKADRASSYALTSKWTVSGLASPESVVLSAAGDFFYVSNVNGEGEVKDGNGFISRVSRDGIMLEREWVTGLDAPKGMAIKDGRLYVADITRVVAFETATGKIYETWDIPGAGFLNDLTVMPDGEVLVADSASGAIYRFAGGTPAIWLKVPKLKSINGLLPSGGKLYATTMQGLLLEIDPVAKGMREIARGLGEADGLARLEDGSFLVGEWPGRLFHVATDGKVTTVTDSRAAQAFINDFLLVDDLTGKVLVVPHWKPGSLEALAIGPRAGR